MCHDKSSSDKELCYISRSLNNEVSVSDGERAVFILREDAGGLSELVVAPRSRLLCLSKLH